jgi:hypothetical protein
MKPKTWADFARSLDEDLPFRQMITITDLIAKVAAPIGILLTGVTRAGMTPDDEQVEVIIRFFGCPGWKCNEVN